MAVKASEKTRCRSALDIVFKSRVSPPEFLERRIPSLGNTFVAERSSGVAKRSHSRGLVCSSKDPHDEDSGIKSVNASIPAEPISGFCSAVEGQQPEIDMHCRGTMNHMVQCAPPTVLIDECPSFPQRAEESSSQMMTVPAAHQHTKHIIALSQLLDPTSDHHLSGHPLVQSIALSGLANAHEAARCAAPRTPISASAVSFGVMSRDRTAAVDVADEVPVADFTCKGVTLIVRNIPRHILQEQILVQLRNDGFSFGTGHLDLSLLYAPAVFGGNLGKPQGQGFGFIHANSSDAARAFMARWHRRHVFGSAREARALDVSKAHMQGVQANLAQWNQTKTRRIRNSRFQPYVADGILALESSSD